jgi:hypothetical protein
MLLALLAALAIGAACGTPGAPTPIVDSALPTDSIASPAAGATEDADETEDATRSP